MLRFIVSRTIRTCQIFQYFKTSHVTVYRIPAVPCLHPCNYFKTSHVTVYPPPIIKDVANVCISKHLMLRFIGNIFIRKAGQTIISKHLMLRFIGMEMMEADTCGYFKTSHVTVYRESKARLTRNSQISKHLMLRFIQTR